GSNEIGTTTVPTVGWPLSTAGWKRQRLTASTAARSSSRDPLPPATSTEVGTPSGPIAARTSTVPLSPRRNARLGYRGGALPAIGRGCDGSETVGASAGGGAAGVTGGAASTRRGSLPTSAGCSISALR